MATIIPRSKLTKAQTLKLQDDRQVLEQISKEAARFRRAGIPDMELEETVRKMKLEISGVIAEFGNLKD